VKGGSPKDDKIHDLSEKHGDPEIKPIALNHL